MSIDFTEKAKRYQAIDEIIASGRKLKWNQIISELGEVYNIKTSRTSFSRDIEELEEKYGAPIDTDFESSGYFYTDPKYRLPRFYTDENAAKAAKLIKTLMDMVKGNPLYKEAQEVFESLAIENHDLSIENIKINKKPENDRIIFVGAPSKEIPGRQLSELLFLSFSSSFFERRAFTPIARPKENSTMREDAGAPREIAVKNITRAVNVSMGRMWRSVRYATDSGEMPCERNRERANFVCVELR